MQFMSIYVSMQITLDQIILFNPSSYNFKLTVAQIINLLYFIVCLRRGLGCLSLPFLCLETTFLTPHVCIYGLCMSVDVNVQRSGEDIGWSAILSLVPLRQVLSLTLVLMFLVRWAASKAQWSSCLWRPHTGVTGTWEPCSPPPSYYGYMDLSSNPYGCRATSLKHWAVWPALREHVSNCISRQMWHSSKTFFHVSGKEQYSASQQSTYCGFICTEI